MRTGWGQGACVGDYDNDGHDDLMVTYLGQNALYHNVGNGQFAEMAEKAGSHTNRCAGARDVRLWTTIRMDGWTCLLRTM